MDIILSPVEYSSDKLNLKINDWKVYSGMSSEDLIEGNWIEDDHLKFQNVKFKEKVFQMDF